MNSLRSGVAKLRTTVSSVANPSPTALGSWKRAEDAVDLVIRARDRAFRHEGASWLV